MRPSVGRIVHHRGYNGAECDAAIVAAVRPANEEHGLPETVGLVIFRSMLGEVIGFEFRNDCRETADENASGWHWPECVE